MSLGLRSLISHENKAYKPKEKNVIYAELFNAFGEILGSYWFGWYYHKRGFFNLWKIILIIFIGIKYTFFIGSSLVAVFGTMIAFGLNIIFLFYISAIFIGIVNLGG